MGERRLFMKVGIVGAGGVGSASLLSLVMRGIACQVVVLDKNHQRAKGVVADLQYGATLSPAAELLAGGYSDLADAALVIITAGANEKTGGATDRNDPAGRLKLLDTNIEVYKDIVPRLHAAAPQAMVLVVTDPPRSAGPCGAHAGARPCPQHRDVSRQLAVSVSPGSPARRQPRL